MVRQLCDVADKYSDGFLRFTVRNNVEFLTPNAENVEPMIAELESLGFPVGGTGMCVSAVSHTQGWLHCDIPATDASGRGQVDDGHGVQRIQGHADAQ